MLKILIFAVFPATGYRETKMLRTALLAVMIAGFATSAMAIDGPKYDRKIEAAVKKIVAKKVGDIRGPFDTEARPIVGDSEAVAVLEPTEKPLV